MNFETWLRKQKDRDDPIGDLAKDFIASKTKTIKESFQKFTPSQDAICAYNRACKGYINFMKKYLDIFSDEFEQDHSLEIE